MSVSLMPMPKQAFYAVDNSGRYVPLVGGKVYTYVGGTVSTPKAAYTDSTGATEQTNPVILDARGEASIWLGAGAYKIVLKDADDSTVWTVDGVSGSAFYSAFDSVGVDLRANEGLIAGQIAFCSGYYANGDLGGGEFFIWDILCDRATRYEKSGGLFLHCSHGFYTLSFCGGDSHEFGSSDRAND